MTRKRVDVITENATGRNQKFRDNYSGEDMTRRQFVTKIEGGQYPKHHVRVVNDIKTPVTNPDSTRDNNLG